MSLELGPTVAIQVPERGVGTVPAGQLGQAGSLPTLEQPKTSPPSRPSAEDEIIHPVPGDVVVGGPLKREGRKAICPQGPPQLTRSNREGSIPDPKRHSQGSVRAGNLGARPDQSGGASRRGLDTTLRQNLPCSSRAEGAAWSQLAVQGEPLPFEGPGRLRRENRRILCLSRQSKTGEKEKRADQGAKSGHRDLQASYRQRGELPAVLFPPTTAFLPLQPLKS